MRDCDEKDVKTALIALKGIAEIEDAYSESRVYHYLYLVNTCC